jgi:MFS family permease
VRTIVLLGITSFFTDIASEMAYPLVPLLLTSTLGAGPAALGLVEGIAESLASILRLFSGMLADRIGKKKPLTIAGYAASAAGKAMLAVAGSWGFVLTARAIDRVGKGIRTAPRDALIAEAAGVRGRGVAFGLHRALDNAGAVAGIATAWGLMMLMKMPPSQVFLWSVAPASIGVLLLFFVKEPGRAAAVAARRPRFGWRTMPAELKRFLVISGVFAMGNSSNTFLLLRAMNGGVVFSNVLLLYLASTVVAMTASVPAGKLSDRIGRKRLLAASYIMYALIYAGFGILKTGTGMAPYVVLFLAYGLYNGIAEGVEKAYVVDLSPPDLRATAIGMHAAVAGSMLLPASIAAGILWGAAGAGAPFIAGAALAVIAASGLAFQRRVA